MPHNYRLACLGRPILDCPSLASIARAVVSSPASSAMTRAMTRLVSLHEVRAKGSLGQGGQNRRGEESEGDADLVGERVSCRCGVVHPRGVLRPRLRERVREALGDVQAPQRFLGKPIPLTGPTKPSSSSRFLIRVPPM